MEGLFRIVGGWRVLKCGCRVHLSTVIGAKRRVRGVEVVADEVVVYFKEGKNLGDKLGEVVG